MQTTARKSRMVLPALLLFAGHCGSLMAQQAYSCTQRLNVQGAGGGTLELLLDSRLTPAIRKQLWGAGDWDFVLPDDSAAYREFSALAPRNAKLIMKDRNGKLVAVRDLEKPLARLAAWNSARAGPWFLLTQDYSVGAGSYNGPITTLINVAQSALSDATALDPASGKVEPIRLMRSLKSDWRITSRTKPEILSLSCFPDDGSEFEIKYIRYTRTGSRWQKYTRRHLGYWESDHPFPGQSEFP